jgi:hypothetical protein
MIKASEKMYSEDYEMNKKDTLISLVKGGVKL